MAFPARIAFSTGTAYYCSPAGSDSTGTGTLANPWKTLTKGWGSLPAVTGGATLYLRGGVYTDRVDPATTGWGGTAAAVKTIASYPGETAIYERFIRVDSAIPVSNIRFQNIEFYGILTVTGEDSIVYGRSGSHWEFLNCNIHGQVGGSAMVVEQPCVDWQWWNCLIHHNGRASTDLDHGLYLEGQNFVVANCAVYENSAYGIQLWPTATGAIIACNTIVGNGKQSTSATIGTAEDTGAIVIAASSPGGSNNNRVVNNILAFNAGYAIKTNSDVSSTDLNVADRNVVYGQTVGQFSFANANAVAVTNTVAADPRLADQAAFNYHIASTSAAAGIGDPNWCPPTDINGVARRSADAGAYAVTAASTAVTFDGTSGYVLAPDAAPAQTDLGDGPFTILFWFKRATLNTFQYVLDKGAGAYSVAFNTDNTLSFGQSGQHDSVTSSTPVTDTTGFHMAAITYSGGLNSNIYLDGVNVSGARVSRVLVDNSAFLYIAAKSNTTLFYSGTLDELVLTKSVLSQATITQLFQAGSSFTAGGPAFLHGGGTLAAAVKKATIAVQVGGSVGGGTIAATGANSTTSTAVLHGGGTLNTAGVQAGNFLGVALHGGGRLQAAGGSSNGRGGPSALHGGGRPTVAGKKQTARTAVLHGGGTPAASSLDVTPSNPTLDGGGQLLEQALANRIGVVVLRGGGQLTRPGQFKTFLSPDNLLETFYHDAELQITFPHTAATQEEEWLLEMLGFVPV